MKKTLVGLFTLVALAIGIQASFAACPCAKPCDSCCPAAPCATPCATPCCDPCAQSCCPASPCSKSDCGCKCGCGCPCCCDDGACAPKCKCTWWKIFEDKTKCYKCNNECCSCLSAKRAHWYKFWTDRCVVKNVRCDDCNCPCN